jgi:hypothetical protein
VQRKKQIAMQKTKTARIKINGEKTTESGIMIAIMIVNPITIEHLIKPAGIAHRKIR